MRDRPRIFCLLASALISGPLAASEADWSDCKREDLDKSKIIAACARIAGDKRASARERAVAFNNRGNAYQIAKDYDRAIADYNQALQLDAGLAHTYLNRALAFKEIGEYGRALADANTAIRLAPDDAVVLRGRGDIYVARGKKAQGDLDAAIADYTEAIRLNPQDPTAYRHRGIAFEAKGDGDHAGQDYNMAIQLGTK
ncbi:MAG: tetratricopeptide repeat protein [Methylocystis sp.]